MPENKPPRPPVAPQKPSRPAKQPAFNPRGPRNNFSLGGRRFNGQAVRRGAKH